MPVTPGTIDQINRYEVGNYPYLTELVTFVGRRVVTRQTVLEQVTIERPDYERGLRDINATYGRMIDPQTGKAFERAVVNPDASPDEGYDLELATEKSSLTNNPGNAPEFSANSAVHPGRKRVYVASPGNGLSDDFEPWEHHYIRRTGRFTDKDGEPLPTFAAMGRALEADGLPAEHGVRISANSAGGAFAKGLMAGLGYNTVTHAYFKNIPGITNHRLGLLWSTVTVIRDMYDDRKTAQRSQDAWKLTAEVVDNAKEVLPNIYGPESKNKQQTKRQMALTTHRPSKMVTTAMALARGGVESDHPAAADTVSALHKQPGALITHHFSLFDRLYSNREDMHRFLEQAYSLGAVAADGQVELVVMIMSGTHRDHTNYPHMRWSAESRAFARTHQSGDTA